MSKAAKKKADRIIRLFDRANVSVRQDWEYINQKGFDFSNDNQLTEEEKLALEEQGMPTFTINRIMPVVEMLNFYATANQPRWNAIGVEGSDSDIAAVFSDMADYIWYGSDGQTLFANAVNDAVTKSIGYLMVTVDKDADNGMGEVKIEQPDPFDIFVDPKSRDILFRDAAYIMIRKLIPKNHLMTLYPDHKSKIKKANNRYGNEFKYTEKEVEGLRKDFHYKDISESDSIDPKTAEQDPLVEFFECYEKEKVALMNVFYRIPPNPEQMEQMQKQVQVKMMELGKELEVQIEEKKLELNMAVESGKMIQARADLELDKMMKAHEEQLQAAQQQYMSELQAAATQTNNVIMTKVQFEKLVDHPGSDVIINNMIDVVAFHKTRIKVTCVAGDQLLYEYYLPEKVDQYPIVPFHYKWTGTPLPISAVSPLIGKQMEINKSHQIMVHNASLGSSLRWLHEEGSLDIDYWEQYASSPGALLPVRPGAQPPTPVQPAPLSNAFFSICQEGKADMEHLAGIYSSMQGDTKAQHETFRGMLAIDEYGTRRVKQWLKNALEPALKEMGIIVMKMSQSVYSANKKFQIVQPSAIQEGKTQEINIPIYNDMGEAIGKSMDYSKAKFDVRIVSGSTLPVNRWAYLDEMKELMKLGVVDDVAVLAETDLKNKQNIIKRKSIYSQMQGQLQSMEQALKDKEGTIETLERQLVQAGIKGKVMQAEVEINKQKEQIKSDAKKEYLETEAKQKLARKVVDTEVDKAKGKLSTAVDKEKVKLELGRQTLLNNLQSNNKDS
tara:strand:- start:193 stop:2538 length:2346 start_codon:yes stop_codon:yes gene_type:complete